jgi:hypothetical protein
MESVNATDSNWYEYNGSVYKLLRTTNTGQVYDQQIYWIQDPESCTVDIAGICKDSSWNHLTDVCPDEPSNLPLGSLFAGSGIIFLILMIALFLTIMKIAIKKK